MTPCLMVVFGMAGEVVRFSDVWSTDDSFEGVRTPESSLWHRGLTLTYIFGDEGFCPYNKISEIGWPSLGNYAIQGEL